MNMRAHNPGQKFRSRLGRILLIRVLLFSLVLTLLFTFIQASLDYRTHLNDVRANMDDIRNVHAKGIVAALWSFEKKVVKAQIEGLRQMRYINYAAVVESGQVLVEDGVKKQQGAINLKIPLSHKHLGKEVPLGELSVQADMSLIQADVVNRVARTVLFSLMLVTITVFFLLWLFDCMVTRYLYSLATYFRDLSGEPDRISAPLRLNKKQRSGYAVWLTG